MAKKKAVWFKRGKEGVVHGKQVDEEARARRESRGPMRFWLDNDQAAKWVWLDTPAFFFYEHNLKIGGVWFNFRTCLKDFDTCPLDEAGDVASYVLAGSGISFKPFTKDGVEYKHQKMLFVAKRKARRKILKEIEKRDGDLRGCVYEISRGTDANEESTGEDLDFLDKKLTEKQLRGFIPKGETEEWLKPFDYEEIFKPKSADELRKLVGGAAPVGAEEEPEEEPEEGKEPEEEEITSIEDLL